MQTLSPLDLLKVNSSLSDVERIKRNAVLPYHLSCSNPYQNQIKAAIDEKRSPKSALEIPTLTEDWNILSTNIDSIINEIGTFQVSSYDGYNNFLTYLDLLQRTITFEINEKSSAIWDKIMDNTAIDSSETESLINELNKGVIEAKSGILKFIEDKESETKELKKKLKNTHFHENLANDLRELSYNDSVSVHFVKNLLDIVGENINFMYASLDDTISNIETRLE